MAAWWSCDRHLGWLDEPNGRQGEGKVEKKKKRHPDGMSEETGAADSVPLEERVESQDSIQRSAAAGSLNSGHPAGSARRSPLEGRIPRTMRFASGSILWLSFSSLLRNSSVTYIVEFAMLT